MLSMAVQAPHSICSLAPSRRYVLLVQAGARWARSAGHHEPAWKYRDRLRDLFRPHPHAELLRAHTQQLFDWISNGSLKLTIGGVYALAEAARAHIDMEGRATTGKLLWIRLRRLLSFNIFFLVSGNSKYTDWFFKAFKRIGPQALYLGFDPGQLHERL